MPNISRPAAISKSLDLTKASWDYDADLPQALNTVSARVKSSKVPSKDSKNVSFTQNPTPVSFNPKKTIFALNGVNGLTGMNGPTGLNSLNPNPTTHLNTRIENEFFSTKPPHFRDRTVSNRPIKIDDNDVFRFDIKKKSRQIKDFTASNKKCMVNFLTKLPKRRPEREGLVGFDGNLIKTQLKNNKNFNEHFRSFERAEIDEQKKMEVLMDIINFNSRCMRKCGDNSGYGKKYAWQSSDEGSASPGKPE